MVNEFQVSTHSLMTHMKIIWFGIVMIQGCEQRTDEYIEIANLSMRGIKDDDLRFELLYPLTTFSVEVIIRLFNNDNNNKYMSLGIFCCTYIHYSFEYFN